MRLSLILALAATPLLAAPAFADCTSDVKDVLTKSMTSGPYHMEIAITSAQGDTTMSGDIDMPDAMHTTMVSAGQTMEMVMVDGKAWMNQAGSWMELPAETATQMAAGMTGATEAMEQGLTNAQCLGTESVDGADYSAYSYDMTAMGVATTTKLYVGSDGLPYQIISDAEVGGQKSTTKATYKFDPSITIKAPM